MNRYLKKAFAAVALGSVGFVGGSLLAQPAVEDLLAQAQTCFPEGTPTPEEIISSPCHDELTNTVGKIMALSWGGAALGLTSGLVLVGRRKKPEGPTL